jgi:hypothetical protein
MRILRHSALMPSLRFRVFVILILAVGFGSGVTVGGVATDMYCGVLGPCIDAGTHSGHHGEAEEQATEHPDCASCPESESTSCDSQKESSDACCSKDCPECFFCHSGPLVLLGAAPASFSIPALATVLQQEEHTLFLPSPPIHQPPRFLKYTQI